MKTVLLSIFLFGVSTANAEQLWKITAYCPCQICCGPKAQGITASGKKVKPGMVACNWLPFGTKLMIDGKQFTVQDRGARSLFGTKKNPIRHIDVFMESHAKARTFGVQYKPVRILK